MFTKFMNRSNMLAPHLHDQMPFGGAVVPIETNNPSLEVIERTPPSLSQRLLNLRIDDPELRKRRQELVSRVASANMEAEQFLDEMLQRRNANLDNELEEIRAAGRTQEKVLSELKMDHEQKVMIFTNLNNEAESLGERIKDARAARLPRFASKETRASHARKIDKMKDELRSLTNEIAKAGQAQMQSFYDLEEAQKAMKKISDAEFRVRGQLSGREFCDPEFGLMVEPS